MELLVYLDDEDKKTFDNLVLYCINNKATALVERDKYFCRLIEKYPTLKNRPIAINRPDGYVFQYSSDKELYTKAKTGSIYV